MRPILLGICAAFFFAFTFILNRAMELSGGSWIWSASLRYIFMVPFLILIVISRKNFLALLKIMKEKPLSWLCWSFVGFVLFYAPLCFAATFAPGWLIAGTWQITIISGSLLVPFFSKTIVTTNGPIQVRERLPIRGLFMSVIIVLGIVIIQLEQANHLSIQNVIIGVLPVIIASFAYPLGNRKMMDLCGERLDTFQRVLGMTLASLPFWLLLSLYGLFTTGAPSRQQTFQSFIVAICSGVIATVLFFRATDLVKGNMQKLAAVEATQSMEVLFSVIGELVLLSAPLPSLLSWGGMFVIMVGMILHSYFSHKSEQSSTQEISA
ncbi:DMT family transporter [Heyndrickxia ginsengihumi]|uniref:DMT family transporter n=1 Tax=Heyndrickxia ginsengihumi TaxID=363870 RepID=UPI003D219650